MKKKIAVWLSVLMIVTIFAGFASEEKAMKRNSDHKEDKIKIVTTIFPEYDWVREIIGEKKENIDIQLLLKNGADLHSYQPNTADLLAISKADMFIYVGGHSDKWVEDALKDPINKNRIVINLFDVLDGELKPLKETEGMADHHEEDHHEEDHHEEEHHHENDEHIWISLRRAIKSVNYISDQIASIDVQNADTYIQNADYYVKQLEKLDQEYRTSISQGKKDTIVFADRFPFFYMADDYGVNYYAAFTGCSAESEASFETVSILANKIDELKLQCLLTIENRTHKIPETIIENTKSQDQTVLTMNSLQSVTEKNIKDGISYLDVMQSNLEVLKKALQ